MWDLFRLVWHRSGCFGQWKWILPGERSEIDGWWWEYFWAWCFGFQELLLPVLICWIPFRMRGLGAGDIKLLCVVGCLNGSRDIIYCICISFLLAAGFSFGRLLNRKQFRTSMRSCIQYFQRIAALGKIVSYDGRKVPGHQIHFSAFILLGYAAVLGVNLCKFIPL